jgi:hypothetical protein
MGYSRIILLVSACFALCEENALSPCRAFYDERNFNGAVTCVLGKADSGRLRDRADSIRAFELAGTASYLKEDFQGAGLYFDRLLLLDKKYQLNPADVPPEILALFESRRQT